MKKSIKNKIYPDPNKEVERWKDKAYEEIRDLPLGKAGEYMGKKASKILTHYGISAAKQVGG